MRAERAGIPAIAVPRLVETSHAATTTGASPMSSRPTGAELVVLAGWMRILTMSFLGRFPEPVVNLHPALPGELAGSHSIERALAEALAGARIDTGVMVHLVPDEGIDDGPVLATADVPIHPHDTLDELESRVHATEHAGSSSRP